ncbi:MAG: hypothetical protein M3361_06830 [Candidatus Tectomicrobia bacterium]|jgi:cell division protein FtsB|nr:hypothetical protein [Candidatus Tectomicrobia bacterium]
MTELRVPPVVKLLLEIAALRLQVKRLEAEVTELKDRMAKLDPSHAEI